MQSSLVAIVAVSVYDTMYPAIGVVNFLCPPSYMAAAKQGCLWTGVELL